VAGDPEVSGGGETGPAGDDDDAGGAAAVVNVRSAPNDVPAGLCATSR
jgi:hypothetical protein